MSILPEERIKEIAEEGLVWLDEDEPNYSAKQHFERMIYQACNETVDKVSEIAEEMRIDAEAYRWSGEYALYKLIQKIESDETKEVNK